MNETTVGGGGSATATIVQSPKSMFAGAPVGPSGDRAVVMTLASRSGAVDVKLQYTPMEMDLSGLAMEHATVSRPGRRSIVVPTAEPLPELSFDVVFAYEDGETSVEGALGALQQLAADGNPITVAIGTSTLGDLWRLTGLTFNIKDRNSLGLVSVASASITLTADTDIDLSVSPISSAILQQPVPPPTTDPTVVQQASDTGSALGQKLLGTWKQWWESADSQDIRDTTDEANTIDIWKAFVDWMFKGKFPKVP